MHLRHRDFQHGTDALVPKYQQGIIVSKSLKSTNEARNTNFCADENPFLKSNLSSTL